MRAALHLAEWQALQAIVDDLGRADGVAWAGLTEAEPAPAWLAFAGADVHAPLEPDRDQGFVQLEGACPVGTAVVALAPPRPGRAYLCGLLLPQGLALVVVPEASDPADGAGNALRVALARLRAALPSGPPPADGALPPPTPPTPPTPLSAWAWLPLPGSGPRGRS